nr:MAG TPA: hypothetical protein [Caudoviricetes sp.]
MIILNIKHISVKTRMLQGMNKRPPTIINISQFEHIV